MATGSFFEIPRPFTLAEIAEQSGCELLRSEHAKMPISAVGPIESASEGCLSFLDNAKYVAALETTRAAAVICSPKYVERMPGHVAVLKSFEPYRAFATAMAMLFPAAMRPLIVTGEAGISDKAIIHPNANLEDDVIVEAGAVIGEGAAIGSGSHIGPGTIIGPHCSVGRNSSICANTTLLHAVVGDDVIVHPGVRIGSDGFGFAMGMAGHQKVPQIGRVIIQDKVEIGANTCIDRGANRDTIIGEGTKIDDQVMIGHNVVVGRHCIIVAQAGIAGSAELGDFVALGGKVAVVGHVKIGAGSQIAGGSGVGENVPPGSIWGGIPARPIQHWLNEMARSRKGARQLSKRKKSR